MIVDDEMSIRKVAGRLLEDLGYDIILAEDGEKAVTLYEKHGHQIDLVILDMVMPVMDGRETLDRLLRLNPDVKVLFSSGYSTNTEVNCLPCKTVLGFVQKPYRKHELAVNVAKALEKASSPAGD
jgi:CheY-like chemotaxis protein